MTPKLGRVTTASPLEVLLNGEATATPAEGPAGWTATVGKEVLVVNVEGRRLVVWAAP